jgi:radical SAM superfamily enzyme YgiQ (UPF0313 family)
VLAEMSKLSVLTGSRCFSFIGDNLAASPHKLLLLCESLRKEAPYYRWDCSLTLDRLRGDDLDLLLEAGCRKIFVGIESASQATLDRIGKSSSVRRTVRLIKKAVDIGLSVHTSFIVGFPWETASDLDKTYALHVGLLKYGIAQSDLTYLCPLPGTDLESEYREMIEPGTGRSKTAVDDLPYGSAGTEIIGRCPELFHQLGRFRTESADPSDLIATVQAARMASSYYERQRREALPQDGTPSD